MSLEHAHQAAMEARRKAVEALKAACPEEWEAWMQLRWATKRALEGREAAQQALVEWHDEHTRDVMKPPLGHLKPRAPAVTWFEWYEEMEYHLQVVENTEPTIRDRQHSEVMAELAPLFKAFDEAWSLRQAVRDARDRAEQAVHAFTPNRLAHFKKVCVLQEEIEAAMELPGAGGLGE